MNNYETFDYDIKCLNRIEYKMVFELKAENKIFKKIFELASVKLKKNHNLKIEEKEINNFYVSKIEPKYLKYIGTVIKKLFNTVRLQLLADRIKLINYSVIEAEFKKKNSEKWSIFITMTGKYIDER